MYPRQRILSLSSFLRGLFYNSNLTNVFDEYKQSIMLAIMRRCSFRLRGAPRVGGSLAVVVAVA